MVVSMIKDAIWGSCIPLTYNRVACHSHVGIPVARACHIVENSLSRGETVL